MEFHEFVAILYNAISPRNDRGNLLGKAPFIRDLLQLNSDESKEMTFANSSDSTLSSYLTRGLSRKLAGEMLKVLEQTKFVKMIDDLSDEQQETIYQELSKHKSDISYENLSESCADIFKAIIRDTAVKENSNNRSLNNITGHEVWNESLAKLTKYWNNSKNVCIIHYACTNFNDPISPARITCIAIRSLADSSTKSFSILDEAQKKQLNRGGILQNFDSIECSMLSEFFDYVKYLHNPIWLHWNMRDAQYGFEALEKRYHYLSGKLECISGKKLILQILSKSYMVTIMRIILGFRMLVYLTISVYYPLSQGMKKQKRFKMVNIIEFKIQYSENYVVFSHSFKDA